MRLIFQNPLWFLAALAAVPLLAHLFSRTRPHTRDFPSLRLLREAMRRVARVRRPRDRWLLLLRTLAMAALAFAFLQPWLVSPFAAQRGAAKTVLLVVDVTASMGYVDGTRTRLAQATLAAEDVLATLSPGSRANVVWLRAHPAGELPEPGPNFDFLRQALRQAVVVSEPGDIAAALELANRQLSTAGGERELVIVSDFQKSAWNGLRWEAPGGVRVTRIAVGDGDSPNTGLAGLALEPARPVAGQDARIVCRVRNFSGEPRRADVFVEAGESHLTQTVEAAPWSETLAIMPVKFPHEGIVPLKATLAEDRFPGDDVRYLLAEVRGALQAGVAGMAEDKTARAWLRAARALDAMSARRITPAQLENPGRPDALFVAGWKGDSAKALQAYVKNGGALVVQPAAGLDPAVVRTLLGLPAAASPEAPPAPEVRDAPGWRLQVKREDHPVFALYANGAFGDPANAHFRRRLGALPFPAGTVLLAFEDGKPALSIFETGGGVVVWWNLDLGASDWPQSTAFLPFFGELLHYLASRSSASPLHGFEPSEPLRFDAGATLNPADVRLLDEHDQAVPIAPEAPGAPTHLATTRSAIPGSYRWMLQGTVLDRAVVNFPEVESDLRRLNPRELASGAGNVIAGSARSRLSDLREGKLLWPWFVGAAAVLLIAEGLTLLLFPAASENKVATAST